MIHQAIETFYITEADGAPPSEQYGRKALDLLAHAGALPSRD